MAVLSDGSRVRFRRLPHLDHAEVLQHVNFRLHDSVPASQIARWHQELSRLDGDESVRSRALFSRIARYEDAGYGQCWLERPALAALVRGALQHFDGERYRLVAWCVMPNHVHVLIETWRGFPLGTVVQSWKRYTARQGNLLLGRGGKEPFWARGYFDRFIRDGGHLEATTRYIHNNPVKAGLVASPELWRWSSAYEGWTEEL